MTDREQMNAFDLDVQALINRYRKEFQLPMAAAIGVLQLRCADLCAEALRDDDDETEEEA